MRQTLPGTFRSTPGDPSLFGWPLDFFGFNPNGIGKSGHTPGVTQIDNMSNLGPGISQNWSLVSVSLQAYLAYYAGDTTAGPGGVGVGTFGTFGKILAGLSLDQALGPTQSNSNAAPYVSPVLQLPTDISLVSTLWDPAIDELPPVFPPTAAGGGFSLLPPLSLMLPISTSIILPVPLGMTAAIQPVLGVWLLPSIIGFSQLNTGLSGAGLGLSYIKYTINYDDGL